MPVTILPDRSDKDVPARGHVVEAEQRESVDVEDEPIEVELVDPFDEEGVGRLDGGYGIVAHFVQAAESVLHHDLTQGRIVCVLGKLEYNIEVKASVSVTFYAYI